MLHFVKRGASVLLDRVNPNPPCVTPGQNPRSKNHDRHHSITASQVKDIKTATLKPQKVTLDGNRAMTVKEAAPALALTLERMKKRGFDITELVEKLHEKAFP